MQGQILVLFFLFICVVSVARRARKRVRVQRRDVAEEKNLWGDVAAGLFDLDASPAAPRLEIVLGAIARKLGVRAAMVTRHERDHCAVVAVAGEEGGILRGLERGSIISRSSLYCGSLRETAPSLAIDYASLSEWRRHPALRERGWEAYLGVACGSEGLVVAFFDSRPRSSPFTRSERALVEQLGPWISAMAGGGPAPGLPALPVLDTQRNA